MHECAHCGQGFTGRKRKYCSGDCRVAANAGHDPAGHKCRECGERFSGRKRKYCSSHCAKEAHARQTRLARSGNEERQWVRPFRAMDYPDHVRTEAERRRHRYKHDPDYRARELARHYKDRARRRLSKSLTDDGTVVPDVLMERDDCLYCGRSLTAENRTIDHMIPLSLGGEHSAANVTPCCLACNSSKQALPFEEWLERLDEPHRGRALREYVRKRGSYPNQSRLALVLT